MTGGGRIRQYGPRESVAILREIVPTIAYKPGWTFELEDVDRGQGCGGLTLMIGATVPNSVADGTVGILHLMPVPPAAYDRETWVRWILDQILLVEKHEAMEFYRVGGEAPFFPEHAPGRDPYAVAMVKTQEQVDAPAKPWVGVPARHP